MTDKKKAVDHSGASRKVKNHLAASDPKSPGHGINHDELKEPTPIYISAPCENVIQGKNNQRIVLGRDRPGAMGTGFGGLGHTQAGCIDIVVGPMGADVKETNKSGEYIFVDPDLGDDAARIYISQKSSVDEYFSLVGSPRNPKTTMSRPLSSIAMKADAVRVIGRESIRLVTGTAAKNSQGGTIDAPGGIDLIAGNDDKDIQPLVKGHNLARALKVLSRNIVTLNGALYDFIERQIRFNNSVAFHVHPNDVSPHNAPGFPSLELGPTLMDWMVDTMQSPVDTLVKQRINLNGFVANYLTENTNNPRYINSRFNHTN